MAVKERPILFSGPMVRAILDGRKTQTRRLVKLRDPSGTYSTHDEVGWPYSADEAGDWSPDPCPYGETGDRLWVRESFAPVPCSGGCEKYPEGFDPKVASVHQPNAPDTGWRYRATWEKSHGGHWKPSIHMPRAACRIVLEVTGVRVERLLDISRDDAFAEGVEAVNPYKLTPDLPPGMPACFRDYQDSGNWFSADPVASFRSLWKSINGAASWAQNPWVWVVKFRKA